MITYYWSRRPGEFLIKETGEPFSIGHDLDLTVREWYQTLIETIVDVRTACIRNQTIPLNAGTLELRAGSRIIPFWNVASCTKH